MNRFDSNEFYLQIEALKDQALENSRTSGRTLKLGAFSASSATAKWDCGTNSTAFLRDHYFKVGDTYPFNSYPTQLRIINGPINGGFEVVFFRLELGKYGAARVRRSMCPDGSYRSAVGVMLGGSAASILEGRNDLDIPTEEDAVLLENTLRKGASS